MKTKTEGKTEREFLEWLYKVIGDDEVDYMWSISGRIGELKATESVDKIKLVAKGCGKRYPIEDCADLFPTMGAICGDNRFQKEGDKPNLCRECMKKVLGMIEKHRKSWNPNFTLWTENDTKAKVGGKED